MVLKLVLLIFSSLVAGIAIIGYHPLPEGVEDPTRTHIFIGVIKIFKTLTSTREWLGYDTYWNSVRDFQDPVVLEGGPGSATYGDVEVRREKIAGVPVIMYRPHSASVDSAPGLIFIHGGGWTVMSADIYDKTAYHYAKETKMVTISVDYRRAPQNPFPAPVQDCLDVTRHILRHGKQYGIDVTKIGIVGDSAGGNMASAVALQLTQEKSDLPPLMFQVLHYPALQVFDFRLPSLVDLNTTIPILTTHDMACFWALYLGLDEKKIESFAHVMEENRHISPEMRKSKLSKYVDTKLLPERFQAPKTTAPPVVAPFDEQLFAKIKDMVVNPLMAPLMASDLAGLPPAFVHVCEFDILRDDALLYARRMEDAGVKVKVYFGKGGYHGDIIRMLPEFLQPRSGEIATAAAIEFMRNMLSKR